MLKKFFEKLGFYKMDEMERNIALKAQRNALIYVALALMVWSFYEAFKVYTQHTTLNLAPSFLLTTATLVLVFSQLFLQRKATKDDDESAKENPIFKVILTSAIVAGVILSVGAFLIISGQ